MKKLFSSVILPIISGISLMYLTSLVMIAEKGFLIVLIRAGAISSLLLVWLSWLNSLNIKNKK